MFDGFPILQAAKSIRSLPQYSRYASKFGGSFNIEKKSFSIRGSKTQANPPMSLRRKGSSAAAGSSTGPLTGSSGTMFFFADHVLHPGMELDRLPLEIIVAVDDLSGFCRFGQGAEFVLSFWSQPTKPRPMAWGPRKIDRPESSPCMIRSAAMLPMLSSLGSPVLFSKTATATSFGSRFEAFFGQKTIAATMTTTTRQRREDDFLWLELDRDFFRGKRFACGRDQLGGDALGRRQAFFDPLEFGPQIARRLISRRWILLQAF